MVDHEHRHAGERHDDARIRRLVRTWRPHAHDHVDASLDAQAASRAGIRAAWVSLVGMLATAALQLVIVAISGSVALLADTVHNLGHLVTTVPLLLAFRLGRRAPTRTYPFGFRRAEDLVGLLIALVIATSVVLIVWDSIRALTDPRPLSNLGWVLAAGLVGTAGNELVAVYRIRVGRRIGSAALVAEGAHARADGLTSLAVVLSVVGVWLGFPRADAVVGLAIAVVITGILVSSTRTVVRRLMDGVEPHIVDSIARVAAGVEGARGAANVRARWSGHRLEAQLDLLVDDGLSVGEAHRLAHRAEAALRDQVAHLEGAIVHVEPAH